MANQFTINLRWTPERDAVLRKMVAEGHSGTKIGAHMGVSRNAVIGRVHRLGLRLGLNKGKRRPTTMRPTSKTLPKPKNFVRSPAKRDVALDEAAALRRLAFQMEAALPPVIEEAAPVPLMVPLVELENSACHWPYGDPKREDFGYCGHPKARGSYCEYHAGKLFAKPVIKFRPMPIREAA